MIKTTTILLIGMLLCLLASCQQEEALPVISGADVPAVFIPTIGSADAGTTSRAADAGATSRAYDDQWEADDKVGIFMFAPPASGSEPVLGSELTFRNVQYNVATPGASTALTAAGTLIKLPASGSAVRFIAYSPYSSTIGTNNVYPVNVATQDPQKNIDLIYHKGVTDYNKTTPNVSLAFTHQLTKVMITVNKDASLADFTPATTAYTCHLVGVPTLADFNLATGALTNLASASVPLPAYFKQSASTATTLLFEAILIPHDGSASYSTRSLRLTIGADTFTYALPTSHAFVGGRQYRYTFLLVGSQLVLTGNTIGDWTSGGEHPAVNITSRE